MDNKTKEVLIKCYEELIGLWSFYGENLTVSNYHMNGAGESLDSFFEDNTTGALDALEELEVIQTYKAYKKLGGK